MKKLMIAAFAVASCTAFADCAQEPEHADVSAPMSGFYDVQITAKRLTHATKTVTKTFSNKKKNGVVTTYAWDLCQDYVKEVSSLAGYEEISRTPTLIDKQGEVKRENVSKITLKYSYHSFKEVKTKRLDADGKVVKDDNNKTVYDYSTNYITKVVTDSLKGVYDANSGKVYTWNTASAAKVTVKAGASKDVIAESKTDRQGKEKDQKGFKAYEVPLAMHGQFIKTDDNKAAGGFTGGVDAAQDGTLLDFSGMTAFGTGTFDTKKGAVKTVSGNIAGKYPDDLKYGCYGTWKINLDANSAKYKDLNAALVKKGCVELINEALK